MEALEWVVRNVLLGLDNIGFAKAGLACLGVLAFLHELHKRSNFQANGTFLLLDQGGVCLCRCKTDRVFFWFSDLLPVVLREVYHVFIHRRW
jgi:hypothetical protein